MTKQIAVSQRLIGRVGSVPGSDGYGFIFLSTVERSDGSAHGLSTERDIFIHQDDCSTRLRPGLVVEFDAMERPGHPGEYRATGAIEIVEAEMIPSTEVVIAGFSAPLPFNSATEMQIATKKLPIHFQMKVVPAATVAQVVANKPMPNVPRSYERSAPEQQEGLLNAFLMHLFPHMANFGTDFRVLDASDEALDAQVREESETLSSLGMIEQVAKIESEIARFKEARATIRFTHEEGLVRPDTIVPMHYLPDLFMAVPVWFYFAGKNDLPSIEGSIVNDDPKVHPWTKHFCDLFPGNRRWADTFQLYNRRMRSLKDYGGDGFDMIPPFVARRLKWATRVFDFVVIATPYHDLAARDWQNIAWVRSIDPYVLGFKKGIPYFFVLGRFSDSGIFPLYHQLVGDTVEFLKKNQGQLDGFDRANNPYWHRGDNSGVSQPRLGTHLKSHVSALLAAFDRGELFDWLRGEDASQAQNQIQQT